MGDRAIKTNHHNHQNTKDCNIMNFRSTLFIVAYFFVFAGCMKTPRFIIRERSYFVTGKESPHVTGHAIASKPDLQEYIDKCTLEPLKQHLMSLTNVTYDTSFIYITTDSELVEIRYHRRICVQPAILNTSVQPGVGVYVIDGDSRVPIKPTEYR